MSDKPYQQRLPLNLAVSVSDLEAWHEDVADLEDQLTLMSARRERLINRIQAAEALFNLLAEGPVVQPLTDTSLFGAESEEEPQEETTGELEQRTFKQELLAAVGKAENGLAPWEAKRTLALGLLGPRLDLSDKGFYNAVTRALESGSLVKHKGRLFHPANLEDFIARAQAGLVEDIEVKPPSPHSPMADAILAIVRQEPGLKSKEIIRRLRNDAEFADTLLKGDTGAHNVIARLVTRGQLIKTVERQFFLDKVA